MQSRCYSNDGCPEIYERWVSGDLNLRKISSVAPKSGCQPLVDVCNWSDVYPSDCETIRRIRSPRGLPAATGGLGAWARRHGYEQIWALITQIAMPPNGGPAVAGPLSTFVHGRRTVDRV